jgi:putative ABC transport system permease protein
VAGRTLYTDGAILGIDPEALGAEAPPNWSWSPGEPVPILAPKALLVAYNRGFAPANGLPRLTEKAALGLRLKLVGLGENGERVTLPAEITGAVRYSGELAGIVPLAVVEHMAAELGADATWSSALVRGAPGTSPDTLQRELQGLGWAIEEIGGVARQLSVAIGAIETVIQLAGALLVGAALLLLAQVHAVLLRQRSGDLRVLRALGASRRLLLGILAAEVLTVAWAAALLGIATGLALATATAATASTHLSDALGVAIPLTAELPAGLATTFLLGAPGIALLASTPSLLRALSGPALDPTDV